MSGNNIPVFTIQQDPINKETKNFKVDPFGETNSMMSEFEDKHRHEYFEIIWLKNRSGPHQIYMIDHFYNGPAPFFLTPARYTN